MICFMVLILMKLWEAHRFGDSRVTLINGTLDEWQEWFLVVRCSLIVDESRECFFV